MKIISTPDISSWKSTLNCYFCASKLEIEGNDLKYKITRKWYSDYDDGHYSNVDYYYVICPICSKELEFTQVGNIPILLKEEVKKRIQK